MKFEYDYIKLVNFTALNAVSLAENNTTLSLINTASTKPNYSSITLANLSDLYNSGTTISAQYSVRDRLAYYVNAIQNSLCTYSNVNDEVLKFFGTGDTLNSYSDQYADRYYNSTTGRKEGIYNTDALWMHPCPNGIEFNTNPQTLLYTGCFLTNDKELKSIGTEGGGDKPYYNNSRNIKEDFIDLFVDIIKDTIAYTTDNKYYYLYNEYENTAAGATKILYYNVNRYLDSSFSSVEATNTRALDESDSTKDKLKVKPKILFNQNNIIRQLNVDFTKNYATIRADNATVSMIVVKKFLLLELYNFYLALTKIKLFSINAEFLRVVTSTAEKVSILNTVLDSVYYKHSNKHWYRSLALQMATASQWVIQFSPFVKNRWQLRNKVKTSTSSKTYEYDSSSSKVKFDLKNLIYVYDGNFLSTLRTFKIDNDGSNGVFAYFIDVFDNKKGAMSISDFCEKYNFSNVISLSEILTTIDSIFYDWLNNISKIDIKLSFCHNNCHINTFTENTGQWECICGQWKSTSVTENATISTREIQMYKPPTAGADDDDDE